MSTRVGSFGIGIRFFVVLLVISVSCKDDDEGFPAAEIITISPDSGPKATIVTIAGSSFGTDTSTVSVTVNGKPTDLISLTNSEISFKVPDKAGSGKVVLKVRGATIENQPVFTYLRSVSTFAGSGGLGNQDGPAAVAEFGNPSGIFVDDKDAVYVTDFVYNSIRLIVNGNVSAPAGKYTYGFRDGTAEVAAFQNPNGITKDKAGNLYVADEFNQLIRKIDTDGNVTSFAGSAGLAGATNGLGAVARFNHPSNIAIDKDGNLYVADQYNHMIRKVTPAGLVSTLAGSGAAAYGDGVGVEAKFNRPAGVAVDENGNVFVGDLFNHRIRKITSTGVVTTLAGSGALGFTDGEAKLSTFRYPAGLAIDADGTVYVADTDNHAVRLVDANGYVTTLTGRSDGYRDGLLNDALFRTPRDIDIGTDGTIYIVDTNDNRVRKID